VVLTLLRSHRDDDKGLAIMARHSYPVHSIRLRTALTHAQLDAALTSAEDKQTLRGGCTTPVHAPAHACNLFLTSGCSSVIGVTFTLERCLRDGTCPQLGMHFF
jgi:hypothetical protein